MIQVTPFHLLFTAFLHKRCSIGLLQITRKSEFATLHFEDLIFTAANLVERIIRGQSWSSSLSTNRISLAEVSCQLKRFFLCFNLTFYPLKLLPLPSHPHSYVFISLFQVLAEKRGERGKLCVSECGRKREGAHTHALLCSRRKSTSSSAFCQLIC